jgi:hypothetical protein
MLYNNLNGFNESNTSDVNDIQTASKKYLAEVSNPYYCVPCRYKVSLKRYFRISNPYFCVCGESVQICIDGCQAIFLVSFVWRSVKAAVLMYGDTTINLRE